MALLEEKGGRDLLFFFFFIFAFPLSSVDFEKHLVGEQIWLEQHRPRVDALELLCE